MPDESTKDEIDHEYVADNLVCPYCGYKVDDTDFRIDNSLNGKEQCPECKRWFKYEGEADCTVYWTTERID